MSESNLRLIASFRDLKTDIGALPFVLVFREIETVVQNVPSDSLAGNEFCYFYFAKMEILVAVRILGTQLVGTALDIF